ncbi:MAG: hypothetical protein ACU841_12930, partial [Gammaproteobacteria bacterium]
MKLEINKYRVRNKTKYFCIGRNKTGTTSLKKAFEDLGATLLDADRAGHAVLESPDVVEAIRRRWGDAVLT